MACCSFFRPWNSWAIKILNLNIQFKYELFLNQLVYCLKNNTIASVMVVVVNKSAYNVLFCTLPNENFTLKEKQNWKWREK